MGAPLHDDLWEGAENVFNFLPGLTPCRFQADADALHHRRFQFGDIGRQTDRETPPQQLFLPRGVVAQSP